MKEAIFWENAFAKKDAKLRVAERSFHPKFLELIGDVSGKRCLDLGCGSGELTCVLATKGAQATGIDGASNAIRIAEERAAKHHLEESTTFIQGDLRNLPNLVEGQFDIIVGKFVLHHVEPLDEMYAAIARLLHPSGRAIFYENSADNRILMWARNNLAGKFGIPKFGDDDEVPLSRQETDLAKQWFDVDLVFHSFIFFKLFGTYLLRSKRLPRPIRRLPHTVDNFLFRNVRALRRYSYHKIVCLTPKKAEH